MSARRAALAVAAISLALGAGPAHAVECEDVFSKVRQRDRLAPLVVGDSVTVPAGNFLGEMGFAVDAVACRTFAQGLEVMSSRPLPDLVVVALGSNGEVSGDELEHALDLVGPFARLALVLPKELGGGADPDGRLMRAFERTHPDQVSVLDWPTHSAGRGAWFAPDGLHITTDGARGFAEMIREAVEFAPVEQVTPPEPEQPDRAPRPARRPEPEPRHRLLARLWSALAGAVAPAVDPVFRFAARIIGPAELAQPDL